MTGNQLYVMETFYSLQGEGFHTGMPAFFIRLAGCHVQCDFCDVKEAWKQESYPLIAVDTLIEQVKQTDARAIVVTGGEPLLQNLDVFCEHAHQAGYLCFLETSGSVPFSGKWDWVCISPKRKCTPLPENLLLADELKVVITSEIDFTWAEMYARQVKTDHCKLFLQSEWSQNKLLMEQIVSYIKKNPIWRLSLQTHKYIAIP